MLALGASFGLAVAAGIAASPLLPFESRAAFALLAFASCLAARNARSWILVPFACGIFASIRADEEADRRRLHVPRAARGWIEVVREEGRGAVFRIEEREFLVAKADSFGIAPGFDVRAFVRLDPIVGQEEPAGFRVERWAKTRHLDGRATILGGIDERRPTAGIAGASRRAADRARDVVRARVVGPGDAAGNLLVALLLGDRRDLEVEDREAFRRAGLSHVLALSGMHVSLLALGLDALLGALRVPRVVTFGVGLLFLTGFTSMTGWLSPVVRAWGTAILARTGGLFERRADPLHSLGLVAGLMLLADPFLFGDLGFRLSFTATTLLILAARSSPGHAARRSRFRAALVSLGGSLLLSTAITLGTMPDLAGTMGRTSLLAPASNLASAIPSFAALGWGALAGFAPLPHEIIDRLARAARLANDALLALCRFAATLPGSDLPIPTPGFAATSIAIAISIFAARRIRPGSRALRAALLVAALAAISSIARDRLTFLDVGQGDSILIEHGTRRALVDAGPPDARPSADGSSLAERAIRRRGANALEVTVLTHGHLDHGGGLPSILRRSLTREFLIPRRAVDAVPPAHLRDLVAIADSSKRIVRTPGFATEASKYLGGTLRVFAGRRAPGASAATEENDLSLVSIWNAGLIGAVLTGDLEIEGEEALLASSPAPMLRAWLLKAGHHGGRASTSSALLNAVQPRVFVASCGTGNTHGHPHAETLARVEERELLFLRTDRDGSIAFTRTGRGVRIRVQRGFI